MIYGTLTQQQIQRAQDFARRHNLPETFVYPAAGVPLAQATVYDAEDPRGPRWKRPVTVVSKDGNATEWRPE